MKIVLGIDLGTQSLKTVCYDYDSKSLIHVHASPLEVDRDENGKAEQSADDWLVALRECTRNIPIEIKNNIEAIGVSGQQHGFVALDENDEVLVPVKLWCDTATQIEADSLNNELGGIDRVISIAGNAIMTGYTCPKILWLKNNRPEEYNKLSTILLPHDYVNFIMTGVKCMEHGDASGTGFLNIKERNWSVEILSALDPDRDLSVCLPPLVRHDHFIGKTSRQFSIDFDLPEGIPVSCGGGDNMMGAIGTGNVTDGKLTMSLGTSGTLYAYSSKPIIDPKGAIAGFCSSTDGWLPLLCTMNCTVATELMRDLVGRSLDEFNNDLDSIPSGSGGLLTIPFFNGERTPNLPKGKASLIGLTSQNCTPAYVLRSAVEGATYALRYGLDELTALGLKVDKIILTGGGAKSPQWRQIVADIFQLPIQILKIEEGASFGAALQALWVLIREKDNNIKLDTIITDHLAVDEGKSSLPNLECKDIYNKGYSDYQNAVNQITPLFK